MTSNDEVFKARLDSFLKNQPITYDYKEVQLQRCGHKRLHPASNNGDEDEQVNSKHCLQCFAQTVPSTTQH